MNGWKYDRKDSGKYGKNDRKYGRSIKGNITGA